MRKLNQKKAFTIIETLMTLLAITIMIAGPLTFMHKSYLYSDFVISKSVSTGLAQESLELATSIRNNSLEKFSDMIGDCSGSVDGDPTMCMLDWDGNSALPTYKTCDTEDDCKLYKNASSTDMYKSSGDTETGQYRYITFITNGTGGYLAKSVAWSYVENIKVKSELDKMFFEIEVK